MTPPVRLTDQWADWIEAALEARAPAERVRYELGFAFVAEEGTGRQRPAVLVTLFLPGALVGSVIQSGVVVPNPGPATEANVVSMVERLLAEVLKERSAQATPPPTNGERRIPPRRPLE